MLTFLSGGCLSVSLIKATINNNFGHNVTGMLKLQNRQLFKEVENGYFEE